MTIDDVLNDGAPPIVAILRGVKPDEVEGIGEALVSAGIRLIEVPLNSPEPLESIRRLIAMLGDRALCGAGTVLKPELVDAVAELGGKLIVTPNVDVSVISRAIQRGMEPMPGFATATEALTAAAAGARRLKLFPSAAFGIGYLKAIGEVLPEGASTWAVGGASPENMSEWLTAGAEGLGVGGAIYRRGDTAEQVFSRVRSFVEAWRRIRSV